MFLGVGPKGGFHSEWGQAGGVEASTKDRWERTHLLLLTGDRGDSECMERSGKTRQALSHQGHLLVSATSPTSSLASAPLILLRSLCPDACSRVIWLSFQPTEAGCPDREDELGGMVDLGGGL